MMLGVSMVRVKDQDKDCFVTKGMCCPLFNYTGKNIVGMGKWKKLVRQAINEVKENGGTYIWVSKHPRPVGKEVYEEDDLLMIPRIGKKLHAFSMVLDYLL